MNWSFLVWFAGATPDWGGLCPSDGDPPELHVYRLYDKLDREVSQD